MVKTKRGEEFISGGFDGEIFTGVLYTIMNLWPLNLNES